MRPGVYVQEIPLPRLINGSGGGASYGAFIGTALQGPTDVQFVTSWSSFQGVYGAFDTAQSTLSSAVYQFFLNGGTAAYVSRVIAADAQAADLTIPSLDDIDTPVLEFTAISGGSWGNGLAIDIVVNHPTATSGSPAAPKPSFDLVVRNTIRGTSVVVERFATLTLDPADARYVEKIVDSTTIGSQYLQANDLNNGLAPTLLPGVLFAEALAGGTNGVQPITPADYAAAVEEFEFITDNLIFNVPGVTGVDALVSRVEARGDSFVVVDAPSDYTPSQILTAAFPVSSYCAVYYPWLGVPDPSSDAPRGSLQFVPPGGAVIGMIMRTDASRGAFKAPAGIGASMTGAVTTQRRLTNADLDSLNDLNINAIRPVPGAGIVVMGARTRDFNTAARYISVRRTLNFIKTQAEQASQFALFEPNTPSLWEQLRVANGSFLSELWQVGGLSGGSFNEAFYVKVDGENNTPQTVANGEVHIEIGVAPVFPAEFIIIKLGQFESTAGYTVTEEI